MADLAIIASTDVDAAALLTNPTEVLLDSGGTPVPATVGTLHGSELIVLRRNASGRPVAPHALDYRANIEALARAGVRRVLTTAMVGSLRRSIPVGTALVLDQFIDFTRDRQSTYFSGHEFGHADMAEPYCPDLRERLLRSAEGLGIPVTSHGCYVCTGGPRFETGAEVRMFAQLGGDVVGFTNVTDCVMAREAGLCFATYAGVVNLGAGLSGQELRSERWHDARAVHAARFGEIVAELVRASARGDTRVTCRCATSAPIEQPAPVADRAPVPRAAVHVRGTDEAPGSPVGRSVYVDLAAGSFHYRMWTAGKGSPPRAVLLHGGAGSVDSWSRVGPALAAEGTPAVALDLRGHGNSVRPPPGSYGLVAVAGDVAEFIAALGLTAPVVIGHCWGAAVALVLATTARHVVPAARLGGLVLEDPPPRFDLHEQAEFLRELRDALRRPEEVISAITRPHWHPADRESVLAGLRTSDPDVLTSLVADGAATGPLLPLFADLEVPTLLMRADPRRGGLLTDDLWAQLGRFPPPNCTTRFVREAPHDIHRGDFAAFMRHTRTFLETINTRTDAL